MINHLQTGKRSLLPYLVLGFLILGYVFRLFYLSIDWRSSGPAISLYTFLIDARFEIGTSMPLNDPGSSSYTKPDGFVYKSQHTEFFLNWGKSRYDYRY